MRSFRRIAAIGSFAGFCAVAFPASAQFVPPKTPPAYSNPYGAQQYSVPNTAAPQVVLGGRCATPSGVCKLNTAGPLGANCTCAVQNGYIPGRIIQ